MASLLQPFPSLTALHDAVTEACCQAIRAAVQQRGICRISLSGGATPRVLYERLVKADLPWGQVHWFWGDERNVPADHADSNERMVRRALLDHVPVEESQIHAVPVDVVDPARAAREYEAVLRAAFGKGDWPAWDLVLLGMGDDAHTASLFPATTALQSRDRWFVENWVEKFAAYRYTLTVPAINSGREIYFLIAGATKQDALAKVLGSERDGNRYPAQLITPTHWFVTADAFPRD